jgi:hypothetical protein
METIEKITIRCFVIGMVFILVWFFMCLTGDWVYEIHSKWFELSKHEFAVAHYCGLMFAKICIFLFFLVPYIACKLCGKRP